MSSFENPADKSGGLTYPAKVTAVESGYETTIFYASKLAGHGDDHFNNEFYVHVLSTTDDGAPVTQKRRVSDYVSTGGKITVTDAFTAALTIDDEILLVHESIGLDKILVSGTLTTSSTTAPADTTLTQDNNYWQGCILMPLSGDAKLQQRYIASSASTGGVLTLDSEHPFTSAPGLVTYVIIQGDGGVACVPAADSTAVQTVGQTVGNKADVASIAATASAIALMRYLYSESFGTEFDGSPDLYDVLVTGWTGAAAATWDGAIIEKLSAIGEKLTAGAYDADTDSLEANRDNIGTAGAALTDLGGMSTGMKAEVELECTEAIEADDLDHLLQLDGATNKYPENCATDSIIAKILVKADPAIPSQYDNSTDSLEAIRDNTGTAGAGLSAVPWNASWDAEVESECTDAIEADDLDHLLMLDGATQKYPENCATDSILAKILVKADPAVPSVYDNSTDSLEAIRDRIDTLNTADQIDLDDIVAGTITNAAGIDVATDVVAVKAETASIQAETTAILVDTGTTIPALLSGGWQLARKSQQILGGGGGRMSSLFLITGTVEAKVYAVMTTAGGGANNVEIGTLNTNTSLYAIKAGNLLTNNFFWEGANVSANMDVSALAEYAINEIVDPEISLTEGINTTGVVEVYCFWKPLGATGDVVAA